LDDEGKFGVDLQWSSAMQQVYFKQVVLPVMNDARTDWESESRLGFPFKVIRDEVIRKGLCDFDVGHSHPTYGSVTPSEKALLYCFCSMRAHFFEALSAFRHFHTVIDGLLARNGDKIFLDLGCGPGTAALAFAEQFGPVEMGYVGIDCAKSMLDKAGEMLAAAKLQKLVAMSSPFIGSQTFDIAGRMATGFSKATSVVINASYLFASHSLDISKICDVVLSLKNCTDVQQLIFVYINSPNTLAGKKYETFKRRMHGQFTGDDQTWASITFRKKIAGPDVGTSTYVRQLLVFKE